MIEIEVRQSLAKKMKRINTITSVVEAGLIISTVIIGERGVGGARVSIVIFACSVCMPVRIALSELANYFLLKKLLHKNILYYLP